MQRADRDESCQLQKARDLLPLLAEQVKAVRSDPEAGPLQKARTIGRLAAIVLKVIEVSNLEGRVEALEGIFKQRTKGESNEPQRPR